MILHVVLFNFSFLTFAQLMFSNRLCLKKFKLLFMKRNFNTDSIGNDFYDDKKKAVWEKAQIIPDVNKDLIRIDRCGALIRWDKYGEIIEKGFGWEIDHIRPVSLNGNDDLSNLQPLQWQNNRHKSDTFPGSDYCKISSNSK